MYRVPSRRKSKNTMAKPNLIPILDAVFIFIFFLLMSANFIKIFEISSDVPIVSSAPPPKNKKKPLALTMKIYNNSLILYTGVPSRTFRKIEKLPDGNYNFEDLRKTLIRIKSRNLDEKAIIFEPIVDLPYEQIVKIMDAVRDLKETDTALYRKGKDGLDEKVEELFNNIIFGNIQS